MTAHPRGSSASAFVVVVVFIPWPNEGMVLVLVIREKVHALTSLLGSMSLIVCSTLKSDQKIVSSVSFG